MSTEKNLTAESKFTLSIKEMIAAAIGFSSLIGMYFTLQADIAQAMELPKPEVSSIEFQYKDELVRSTIDNIQSDVTTVKEDVSEIKESLAKMDESVIKIPELKRKLPKQVNHITLILILKYLEQSNKILTSLKGITWIHNNNPFDITSKDFPE